MGWAMVAGLGLMGAGTVYSAIQQKQMADYNADIIRTEAEAEAERAKIEEARHREKINKFMGTQRAMYGKSGLSMEGSPLLVMEETAAQGELDAMLIRQAGQARVAELTAERNMVKMGGRQAFYGGLTKAGGSLLTGAAMYYK